MNRPEALDDSPSDSLHPTRCYFLDWARIAAFALLVPYHVGMLYVRWDFHVKSAYAGPGLEPWMKLSSPWRLGLLFVISGAATAMMLRRGAETGWLRQRSARLLLPLLCGMLLVVPPQSYFEVVQKYGYAGGYLDFLRLYLSGYHGFCSAAGRCLVLPTWNHLWFLPYLWLYTLLLWLACRAWPGALDAMASKLASALRGTALLWVPIAVLAALRLALFARFPSTHALVDDGFNHAVYLTLFLTGAAFARAPAVWLRLAEWRRPALGIALAAWAVLVSPAWAVLPAALRHIDIAALQWTAIVAALGFAKRHLDVDHPWRQRLSEAVFPFYLLHQTVIVVLSRLLAPLHWRPGLEGPVLIVATFALSLAGYALVSRIAVLRPWFGLAAKAPPPRPPSLPAPSSTEVAR